MSETQTHPGVKLVIRRRYAASRERIWSAWTDPEETKNIHPAEMTVPDFQCDFRVGGSYRLTMQRPDGEKYIAKGVYREIQPPERLVYTWTWEEDTPQEERETLVTLELRDLGGKTELVLTHDGLASEESREAHNGGWGQTLDSLGKIVEP